MHFKIDKEDQLDMTLGEWTELQKSKPRKKPQKPKYKTVHLVVDERLINANDAPFAFTQCQLRMSLNKQEETQRLAPH